MIRQGDTKKELPKLVWSSAVKTLLLVASLIYREVNAQNHYQCIKEGYHADPKDCHVYYRCVNWGTTTSESPSPLTKFKFECGPGTVFSHIKGNICVHPNDSERPECRKSENDLDFNMNDYEDNQEEIYPHPSWPSSSRRPSNYPSYIPPGYPNEGYTSNGQQRPNNNPSYIPQMDTNQGYTPESLPKPSNIPSYIPPSVDSTTYKSTSGTEGLIESAELLPPPVTGIDNSGCSREGFMVHPKDCKKFIRCVSNGTGYYQKFEFTCGEGTLWDSTIEACNHEWAVKGNCFSEPTSTQSNDSGTTDSYQQSTNKKSTVLIKPTQSSGYLPPSTLRPVTPKPSQTQLPIGSLSTITQEPLTPYPSTPSSFDMTSITPTMTTQANYTPQSISNDDCIVEGFFSNPENCRKFYRCVAQEGQKLIKYEFECGEGTAWDTNIQACNHEYIVSECNSSFNNGSTDASLTGTINNDEKKNKTTSEKDSNTTKEPETFTKEELKPSNDITGFSSFKPTSTTISMSTIKEETNPTTESSISTETLMPTETSTSSEAIISVSMTSISDVSSTITTSTSLSSTNTTPNEQLAISKCKDEGFYADPNDCHKFYRCVKTNGKYTKYNFECAPGTAWDQSILTCNYAHLVSLCSPETNEIPSFTKETEKPMDSTKKPKENDYSSSMTPTTIFASTTTTTTSSSTQANIEAITTNKNNESNENNNKDTEPTTESLEKSSTTMETLNTSDLSTTDSNTSGSTKPNLLNDKIKCDSTGFYPHPTQCDKFYRCVDNGNGYNIYHFNCAPGTIFDPSISVCNYPESIYPLRDCSGNPSSSSSSSPSTTVMSPINTSETEITTQISTTTSLDIDEGTTTEFTEETTEIEITTEGLDQTSTEKDIDTSTMSTEGMIESTTIEESGSTATESDSKTSTEPTTETEAESSTDSDKPITTTTTTIEPDISLPVAPCTLGNLTDEQIVLVCPTGFRRHPKYCNMFYQCTSEGNMAIKILVLVCPENTIFDEEKVQCLAESENSQPCNTELTPARFYRQIEKSSIQPIRATRDSLCPGEGHYPYQKGCSNVFYKCKRNQKNSLQGYLYRCPNDFVYWSVSRRCEKASRLRTCSQEQHDKDREEIDTWNKRWELPIEDSNLSARMIHF
ncbi:location of vulva defective 1-like [Chelonus insularis]|uniref:location of vulva defective 1-like n=1 Tax=Chelonus insularis TaxID=460826 RepID=UPI00158B45AA|nr:location of vulva defective 1-like [Chelonus insularis]